MVTTISDTSSSDPIALWLAIGALTVSLLSAVVPALTGRQQRLRDDRAQRAERYLELLQLVELHGLWVVDETYNLLQRRDEPWVEEMPRRPVTMPERSQRVRARAIVSAFGSVLVATSFARWERALEAFEEKLAEFSFIAHVEGDDSVNASEAAPLKEEEVTARALLADAVNYQLVLERRWRRWGRTAADVVGTVVPIR